MYEFNYQRPGSLDDAVNALRSAEDGQFMAGGMTLLPTLKQRLARPSDVIDLAGVPGLSGISEEGGNIVVGAMTRHAEVASSTVVQTAIPALAALADAAGPAYRISVFDAGACTPTMSMQRRS